MRHVVQLLTLPLAAALATSLWAGPSDPPRQPEPPNEDLAPVFVQAVIAMEAEPFEFSGPGVDPPPHVINHPALNLSVDAGPFSPEKSGCTPTSLNPKTPLSCGPGPLVNLGCAEVLADDSLGGLGVPIAVCRSPLGVNDFDVRPNDYVRLRGGFFRTLERYVTFTDGQYHLIRNQFELRATLGAVKTPQQALSYAIAATGLRRVSGLVVIDDGSRRYFVDPLEDTFVTREIGGFLIRNLVLENYMGCPPHQTWFITVLVTEDGLVQERSKVLAFEIDDGICVD